MTVERCVECGFDSVAWSDDSAIAAIHDLASQWTSAVSGLTLSDLRRRPVRQMWSIAEYADHVREVLFGMRFVLDIALAEPGTDLGDSPPSMFASQPRPVDVPAALEGIDREAGSLRQQLSLLAPREWSLVVKFDGTFVDPHWIARHAIHDSSHHLLDVSRLRSAL